MISISIEKGIAKEKQLISDLAYYCVKKLMPRKRNLEVDIIQVKNLEDKEGDLASCVDTDNTNTFEIRLDKDMSLRKKLLSVAHEMVHVKQFTRKELEHTSSVNRQLWRGKKYNTKNRYYDLPWEIEAYGRELGLFNRWVIDNNVKGNFTKDPT
jgi:hypothetical protein